MSYPGSEFSSPSPEKRPSSPSLGVLRDISRILGHSLDLPSLVHHFVLKVREIIGVNRVAIFLEDQTGGSPGSCRQQSARLRCICAVGVPPDVQNCVELSRKGGIGRWVTHSSQILRAEQAGALLPPAEAARVRHEFDLLNCQVAIPINDRERAIGIALLGGHLTRISFSDDELQLMFHLMEELGLSVKNSWLHTEVAASRRLFGDVLTSLHSGNLVVGPGLEILHANPAIRRFLDVPLDPDSPIAFAHLPPAIASRVHEVVEKGNPVEPFEFVPGDNGSPIYRISIIPFRTAEQRLPQSAMVIMEDFTEIERAKRMAVEAANLKLTNLIAKRFAHEIRNSLVPLATHLQLLDEQYEDPGFRDSLKNSLALETSRISRFTEQMLYLAEPRFPPIALTSLEKLLREAFSQAESYLRMEGVLNLHAPSPTPAVRCHPQALRHAFQEIFLNALQSAPAPATVAVEILVRQDGETTNLVLQIRDSGPGFTPEAAARSQEPFFTTRTTGVGLGLTVVRKVISEMGGALTIHPRTDGTDPDLQLTLLSDRNHA